MTASGVGDTVLGKYKFRGYTRITTEVPGSRFPTVNAFNRNESQASLIIGEEENIKQLDGEYFLQVLADGPWKLKMERE